MVFVANSGFLRGPLRLKKGAAKAHPWQQTGRAEAQWACPYSLKGSL